VPVNALSLEPTSRSVGLQRTLGLEEAHASPCAGTFRAWDCVEAPSFSYGVLHSCWYDPARPSKTVLDRDESSGPFIFSIVFFGAGLVFFILILLYIRSSVRKRREVP